MMDKMLNPMMRRYPMFAWIGFIIVIVSFLLAISAANANGVFFSADKATREAAESGSALVAAHVAFRSISTWVPAFKFLGLGVLLGAITMALGVIIQTLRDLGNSVTARWPSNLNPGTPEKPMAAKLFPMIMMMGWIVLIVGFIWALSLNGVVTSYWNHAIAGELNPAQPGSTLLQQLAIIQGTLPWLNALRLLGMAFLFTGITIALTVIIRTLQFQEKVLEKFVQARAGKAS